MRRREFIALLGGAAAAWPRAAGEQQPALPVVGVLNVGSPRLVAYRMHAFRDGLGDAGYTEGQNVAIEYGWAEGQNDRLPALAADLVRQQVAVILPGGIPAALAAKAATATIPIVFTVGDQDPVTSGLVASLNRPGGDLTGVSNLNVELGPKRLELLHDLVPAATTMALLINPTNPNARTLLKDLQETARVLGLHLHALHASTERDFDMAFATILELRAGALLIGPDPFFTSLSERLAALAMRHAVPAIFQFREFAEAGGL